MKRFFLILLSTILTGICYSQNNIRDILIGTWKGTDATNKTGTITFLDSIHIIFVIPNGQSLKGNYIIDETKSPIWIDIIPDGAKANRSFYGYLKILNSAKLKLQLFFDGIRPKNPPEETSDDTQLFKKIKA